MVNFTLMCTRYGFFTPMAVAETALQARAAPLYDWQPVHCAAPGQVMPVITNEFPDVLQFFRWGLTPQWAKDDKMGLGMFNTLKEKITEKPSYQSIFRYKRCIAPANGWFDWRPPTGGTAKTAKNKQPYYFHPYGGGLLLMAGLWDVWREGLYSFSIITVPAAGKLAAAVAHVPALLKPSAARQWLQKAAAGKSDRAGPS
jgi:putative SOS response-associated peptidase YedK